MTTAGGSAAEGRVSVELRSVPDCPNLAPARQELRGALVDLGLPLAVVTEVVGDYPSPSILVNGVDVMGGTGDDSAACRLDLPTGDRIRAALRQAVGAGSATAETELSLVDCCAQPGNAIRADRPHRAEQHIPDLDPRSSCPRFQTGHACTDRRDGAALWVSGDRGPGSGAVAGVGRAAPAV